MHTTSVLLLLASGSSIAFAAVAALNEYAWVAILTALTGLVSAVGGMMKLLREVRQVHTIVNSQKAALLQRIDDLEKLVSAGLAREHAAAAAAPKKG